MKSRSGAAGDDVSKQTTRRCEVISSSTYIYIELKDNHRIRQNAASRVLMCVLQTGALFLYIGPYTNFHLG
jgi:hypothetical protein